MNQTENGQLVEIAKHVGILNEELGCVKNDVGKLKIDIVWIKKILFAIAGMIFVGIGKVLFFG